jgi:hypothetical protein
VPNTCEEIRKIRTDTNLKTDLLNLNNQTYPANLHKTAYRPRNSKLEMGIQRAKENVGCIKRRKNELEGTFAGIA